MRKESDEIRTRIAELRMEKQKLESSLKYLGKILYEYKIGVRFEWDRDTLRKNTDEKYIKVRNALEETYNELNTLYNEWRT